MFDVTQKSQIKSKPNYDWRPQNTYIRRPPYWEGGMVGEKTLKGMRPLAVLPDNITTDHLSPSNAIMMDSAAGDHLTAQRATFANPKLFNEMVRDENGKVGQGSLARIEPEGKVTRMWEAIAAEGFERIHRTNLVGMGVMPLQFEEGTTRKTLAIDGTETYDVEGTAAPRAELTLVIHRKSGSTERVPVICRLDTAEELSIYSAGGVLQRFAEDFLQSAVGV